MGEQLSPVKAGRTCEDGKRKDSKAASRSRPCCLAQAASPDTIVQQGHIECLTSVELRIKAEGQKKANTSEREALQEEEGRLAVLFQVSKEVGCSYQNYTPPYHVVSREAVDIESRTTAIKKNKSHNNNQVLTCTSYLQTWQTHQPIGLHTCLERFF